MSLGTTEKRLGGMNIGNWFVNSLGMSHFTKCASITEYWQGMMSVLIKVPVFGPTENILVATPLGVEEP